jgi:hypothetical protein
MNGMDKLNRRDFLRLFGGNAVQGASRALAAAVPQPAETPPARKARSLPVREPETAEGSARCVRCYAPFNPEAAETFCAMCLDSERKERELMADALARLSAHASALTGEATPVTTE